MASPARDPDPFVGAVIADRYRIVRLLGKGGMGSVYEAEHVAIGRRVAIKRLASDLTDDSEVFARFRREAEVVAGFQHPHIVSVLDWVTLDDGSPCIVMEHLKGEDLAARVTRLGPLAWPELARIADEVLSALAVAHRAGIVHRDLKPHNIFLAVDDEGRVSAKLLDFGVSKIHDSATLATPETHMIGTPAYMAPEQARGQSKAVDACTDLWAMGVVLFQMATGALPFEADSVPATLYQICHDHPGEVTDYRSDAPAALIEAIEGCLQRDKIARTQSADSLRRQLRKALGELAPTAFRAPVGKARGRVQPVTGTMNTLAAPVSGTAIAPTLPSSAGRPGTVTTLSSSSGEMPAASRPRRNRLGIAGLIACMAVGATAIVLAVVPVGLGRDQQPEPLPAQAAAPPTPVKPAVAPPTPEKPTVTMVILSEPSGAHVYDSNNRYLGVTPLSHDSDRTGGSLAITMRLDGYTELRAEVPLVAGETEPLVLEPTPRPRRQGRRRADRKPEPTPAPSVSPEPTEPAEPVEPESKRQLRGPYAEDL